jgi:hemerythrin-like domain-containing protein
MDRCSLCRRDPERVTQESRTMDESSVFQRMRADHRRVLAEMDALERAVGPMACSRTFAPDLEDHVRRTATLLARQFSSHMAGEDELLYPALIEALEGTRPTLAPLQAEHVELRTMLDALGRLLEAPPSAKRDEQITVQVHDLIDLLRIHIRKEETAVLLVAERILPPDVIQRLAARLRVHDSAPPAA